MEKVNLPIDLLNQNLARMTKERIESPKLAKIFLKEHPEVWHAVGQRRRSQEGGCGAVGRAYLPVNRRRRHGYRDDRRRSLDKRSSDLRDNAYVPRKLHVLHRRLGQRLGRQAGHQLRRRVPAHLRHAVVGHRQSRRPAARRAVVVDAGHRRPGLARHPQSHSPRR
jgi:hypothetical protein